jgi:hypothetical protein
VFLLACPVDAWSTGRETDTAARPSHYGLARRFDVSIRERIFRLLDRGGVEVDPDEFVEFAVVHVGAGPLLVERLRGAGIEAEGHDTFNPVTQVLSDYSIRVRRRDLTAAAQVYD